MRDCCQIIEQIIKEIPTDRTDFIVDLQKDHYNASFKAPEEILQWERLQNTLTRYIPESKEDWEDWEFRVLSIFTTKPVDILKNRKDISLL